MKTAILTILCTIASIAIMLVAFHIGMGRELCTRDLTQAEKVAMRLTCD